jgi:uncharacterized membrane protein YvbJ|tara:strand:+ start:244 stop:474 length:231 start_codon:yes stop_codon:yes gene_type:complete
MTKMPEEAANELWKALNRLKDKEKVVTELYDKLEVATEIIKAYVGYLNSHLSETEQLLVDKSREFLGEDDESRRYS